MLKILHQPYPLPEVTTRTLLDCVVEGTFIALFLIVFQPFGIADWHDPNRTYYLIGFGIVTMIFGAIFRFGIRRLFKNYFQEKNWTIGREFIAIMGIILCIATGNYFYSQFIFHTSLSLYNFFWTFAITLLIGVFPVTFGILFNYIYQLKKYNQFVEIHPKQAIDNQPITVKNQPLKLMADNEKDLLEMDENDLFFIESSDNYSTVFFLKNGKMQKELLRSSLSRLESQINSPQIVRCHRSYIVNLAKVGRVSGNAQGYKLHLEWLELLVPVARKYSEVVEQLK